VTSRVVARALLPYVINLPSFLSSCIHTRASPATRILPVDNSSRDDAIGQLFSKEAQIAISRRSGPVLARRRARTPVQPGFDRSVVLDQRRGIF
jgi:hypothetical protein